MQTIIDKTVEYVARNGREFETTLRNAQKNNKKFDFLSSNHRFQKYYR